jgi:hypothetical protein
MSLTNDKPATLELLEARLGTRLAAGLNQRTAALPHDVAARLRVSRDLALGRAAQARRQQGPVWAAATGSSGQGTAWLAGPDRVWHHLASWLPLVLLIAGLVLIQHWSQRERALAAAEIDAVLLADDLPLMAWTDPGFREYMKAPPR